MTATHAAGVAPSVQGYLTPMDMARYRRPIAACLCAGVALSGAGVARSVLGGPEPDAAPDSADVQVWAESGGTASSAPAPGFLGPQHETKTDPTPERFVFAVDPRRR